MTPKEASALMNDIGALICELGNTEPDKERADKFFALWSWMCRMKAYIGGYDHFGDYQQFRKEFWHKYRLEKYGYD